MHLDETTNIGDVINGQVPVDYNADGPGNVFGTGTHNVAGMTSGGQPIVVTFANGVYTGTAGGRPIFTLDLESDGSYTFTQHAGIDHPDTGDHNENLAFPLEFGIQAVDGDGSLSNTGKIIVKICDDGPTIASASLLLDETNDLGNVLTGNFFADYGADDVGGDIYPGNANGQVDFSVVGNYPLTVNGDPVLVSIVGDSYVGTVNGQNVFTLEINENGTYTFTLNQGLDHPDPTQPNEALALRFGTAIQDGDGDTDTARITITILDDDDGSHSVPGEHFCGHQGVNEVFVGTAGDDTFWGGALDQDTLTGGDGADRFVLESFSEWNGDKFYDIVTDYDFAEGDVIDLSELLDVNSFTASGSDIHDFVKIDGNELQFSWDSGDTMPFGTLVDLGGYNGMVRFSVGDQVIEVDMSDLHAI